VKNRARRLDKDAAALLLFLAARGYASRRSAQAEVGIYLVSNSVLRRLKRTYLSIDAPTVDVLAFPEPRAFPHPETERQVLGEVLLNKDLAANRQTALRLLIHGCLHLLGYRHVRKRDRMEMNKIEKEAYRALARPQ